jgi:hypothetical protein
VKRLTTRLKRARRDLDALLADRRPAATADPAARERLTKALTEAFAKLPPEVVSQLLATVRHAGGDRGVMTAALTDALSRLPADVVGQVLAAAKAARPQREVAATCPA